LEAEKMRKICIFNIKGGVGKTTTAVNIASGLARKGKKVLILDMDAQGSVNSCLSSNDSEKDMYNLIAQGAKLEECLTHMGQNLDAVTSRENLHDIDSELSDKPNKDFILSTKLEKIKGYDYIILDCPPQFAIMTKNALFFSDEVFIPVSTDVLGYKGLKKTLQLINKLNEDVEYYKTNITKIIPTMYDQRLNVSKLILAKLEDEHYGKVSNPIRANSKLKEAPQKRMSIFAYAKSSPGAEDYGKLVDDIMYNESPKSEEEPAEGVIRTSTKKFKGITKIFAGKLFNSN
jgi:chromosome partitioning protein